MRTVAFFRSLNNPCPCYIRVRKYGFLAIVKEQLLSANPAGDIHGCRIHPSSRCFVKRGALGFRVYGFRVRFRV